MTNGGRAPKFRRIAFVDMEASGLGSASFPTEIGWALVRDDGSVESGSVLIRPPARWFSAVIDLSSTWGPAPPLLRPAKTTMADGHMSLGMRR
jgi:hypothetical protein